MKRTKKLLSLALAVICTLSVFPQSASAFSDESVSDISAKEFSVRSQLAEGESPDLADVIEIVEEYMDANLFADGITACVDEASGCIQIMQLSGGNSVTRNGMPPELVCTSLLLMDADGRIVDANSYIREPYVPEDKNP